MSKKFSRDDLEKFHDYDIFVPTRTVWVGSTVNDEGDESGIDAAMAERFIKNLHFLDRISSDPITIIMNNLGGFWFHGMAMYDAIKACRSYVIIRGSGQVMSMGTIILQAANERVLEPNVAFMVHDGYDGFEGTPKSFEAWARFSKKIRKKMYKIYAERSGRSESFWERTCSHDRVMTAEEAVKMGLADRIDYPREPSS